MEVSKFRKLYEYDETKRSVVIFRDNRKLADNPYNNREEISLPDQCGVNLQSGNHRRRRSASGPKRRRDDR